MKKSNLQEVHLQVEPTATFSICFSRKCKKAQQIGMFMRKNEQELCGTAIFESIESRENRKTRWRHNVT